MGDDNPTSRRWIILAMLLAVTIINFIDRQTLSVLAPKIREIFHLSNRSYGQIVAAFQFGMMTGEFPVGWIMDRRGVRFGLAAAVLWWSAGTGLHAFARSGTHLGLLRYWMGTGECGNFSGGVKTVNEWFPKNERALAIGVFNSGSMIGATIAPPLIVYLATRHGYQWAFLLPAALGLLWVPLWRKVYRRRDQQLFAGTGLRVEQTASKDLLQSRQSWAIMACRFFVGPVSQFYWYWMPNYLASVRGLSLQEIGSLSWIPYVLGDIGSVCGGLAAGWLLRRRFSVAVTRQITMYFGAICCLASFAVYLVPTASQALGVISIVLFGHTFLSANMFAVVTDMFPDQAVGRVTGLHGLCGGLSGLLFPLLTGELVDRFSYSPVFILAALMPLTGVVLLFVISNGLQHFASAHSQRAVTT